MADATDQLTNQSLATLLRQLGFESSETTEKFQRAWRHPETDTVIFLPANKIDEPPLHADLLSLRTHLDSNGHLNGSVFDEFVRTGNLPVVL